MGLWASEVYQTKTYCVRTPSAQAKNVGVGAPTLLEFPFTIAQQMTVDNDFLTFKYFRPINYVSGTDLGFNLNWTKSQDTDQSGKKVKWQMEYLFLDIGDDVSNATPDGTLTSERTYLDAGTTEHIAYNTGSDLTIPTANINEDKAYLYLKVSAIAPSSNGLAEPALLTVCYDYWGYSANYPVP